MDTVTDGTIFSSAHARVRVRFCIQVCFLVCFSMPKNVQVCVRVRVCLQLPSGLQKSTWQYG